MYHDIGELTKTLHHNQCKTASAFKLLGDLGYSYKADKGWYKEPAVYNKPKWVTFDASKDLMGAFLDSLEDGKDYRVEYFTYSNNSVGKSYILSNGVRAHESFFHQVEKEDLLPAQVEQEEGESVLEWMEGFEDLVYSGYNLVDGDYLDLRKLSKEQINFLKHVVLSYSKSTFDKPHTNAVFKAGYGFIGDVFKRTDKQKEISFNNLFISKP